MPASITSGRVGIVCFQELAITGFHCHCCQPALRASRVRHESPLIRAVYNLLREAERRAQSVGSSGSADGQKTKTCCLI